MEPKGAIPAASQMDCGPRCRSKHHAQQLVTAVTRGSTRQIQLFLSRCHNATTLSDLFGRSVLHMAASRGHWQVVEWLLRECKVEIGARDLESGWTPLHRALFYGHLHGARLLIEYGSNLQARDKEGLTPLDIVMKDRLPHVEFLTTDVNEVYTWGENVNTTLGHGNMQPRKQPEVVDFFRKNSISIKQVVMSKYHTVFRSAAGKVYTCGHGRGGRLGHGNEQTCLEPQVVESLQAEECVQVASARDHTVFFTDSGALYSCGLNDSHQLGQLPPPTSSLIPKQITHRLLKGRVIKGVCTRRFHTVIYTHDAVFTLGLNAGQLGHLKVPGEQYVTQPRQVSALNNKDLQINLVACSDAATVVMTTKWDIYALHEYQCRKVVSKCRDITQVTVTGGHLDHSSDLETLQEKGGTDLTIVLLNSVGRVYIWRASDPCLRRCAWSIQRPLHITQLALSVQNMAFVTQDGEAFQGCIPRGGRQTSVSYSKGDVTATSPVDTFSVSLTELIERDDILDVRITRVPGIHRATGIVVDSKGNNFAVLQSQPNGCLTEVGTIQGSEMENHMHVLFEEANELDLIHDVIIQVDKETFAAHRYMLATRSDFFRKALTPKREDCDQINEAPPVIKLENVNIDLLRQMLLFMYTDTCELLTVGSKFTFTSDSRAVHHQGVDKTNHQQGAHKNKKKTKPGGRSKKGERKTEGEDGQTQNPVRFLLEMARRFGVKNLIKRLAAVKFVNGKVENVVGKHLPAPRPRFDRSKFGMFYDVCIRGDSGEPVECHKCVLVARLEYFHSMLASGWIETSNTEALTLPVPGNILSSILDFLYSDDAATVEACEDVETLCNILVVADQLLIGRLKDITEVTIATLLTLRNVAEVLEFASLYNASQLKRTCQQYICLNLVALLESRALDILSDDVIDDLTRYYRTMVSGMCRRQVTPFDEWPDAAYLEALEADADEQTSAATWRDAEASIRKTKGRRKRTRTKSSGDEMGMENTDARGIVRMTEHQVSVSSDLDFSLELEEVVEEEMTPEQLPASFPDPPSQPLTIPVHASSNPWAVHNPRPESGPPDSPELGSTAELVTPSRSVSPPLHTPRGLRDIMAEQHCLDQHKRAHKASGASKKVGKLSQRERKKMAMHSSTPVKEDLEGLVPELSGSEPPVAKSAPAGNVWASVNNVVASFKDLMLRQEAEISRHKSSTASSFSMAAPPVVKAAGAKVTSPSVSNRAGPGGDGSHSWGLPTSAVRAGQQSPQPASSPPPAMSPTGTGQSPWLQQRPPVARTMSFSEILHDELQQNAILEKLTNKPLHLIQLEEQAIQELLLYYRAADTREEHITVTREHSHLAPPTWAATQ